MTKPIRDTPYCRLYIDTNDTREAVQARLDLTMSSEFGSFPAYRAVRKNHGYIAAETGWNWTEANPEPPR